jgi:hypothetical protein
MRTVWKYTNSTKFMNFDDRCRLESQGVNGKHDKSLHVTGSAKVYTGRLEDVYLLCQSDDMERLGR